MCMLRYQLSLLFGVFEGERDFGFDVGRSPLPRHCVDQQVDQHVVVLQKRDATVSMVEGHIGPDGADVGVDLTRVTRHAGLEAWERSFLNKHVNGLAQSLLTSPA